MVLLFMVASEMKKYVLYTLIFIFIVAGIDVIAGVVFKQMQKKARGGTGAEYYVCKKGDEDILVMGSSRASHHYVPEILMDSLRMSCYNGGQDGNGIVMQYGRWKMISKRHIPKVIIYDIEPAFDLMVNDNFRYVDRLKPYAEDSDVRGYIEGLFPMERLKLVSKMYCFNYKFLELLSDCVRPSETNSGYKPNRGHIRQEVINAELKKEKTEILEVDEVKMNCLKAFISEAKNKGVIVILVSSPYWKGYSDIDLRFVREMADYMNVPFINYADSGIRNNPDLFADSMHLNDEGAHVFSRDFAQVVKRFLIQYF